MFIDIVGYTTTTTELNREDFNHFHDIFDSLALPTFSEFGGEVIKKIGDAFLITFKSATDAVLCGITLQEKFRAYNIENRTQRPILIRVVLHAGEVLIRNGDVFGDAVNTASRIENIAQAGHIVLSESVYNAMNKNEVKVIFLARHKFRGLRHPLAIFRVQTKKDQIVMKRHRKQNGHKKKFKTIIRLIVGISLVIVGLIVLYFILQNKNLI